MNFALLVPGALAALAALAIPLLLHIAKRSDERRTVFAALRWLREKPKPRQRLRFDEIPLLVARLLLLAALAVLLARPLLRNVDQGKHWVVALPGISADAVRKAANDDSAELHWLAPRFPKIESGEARSDVAFPSLLRELDATLPATTALTVIVPEQLSGADAQRPALGRKVEWKTLPGTFPPASPKQIALQLDVSQLPPSFAGLNYLRAVNAAWNADAAKATQIRVLPTTQVGLQFHPALRDARGAALAETARDANGIALRFTRELTPGAMPELLDADFPQRLRDAVLPPPAPARAIAPDYAPTVTAATAQMQAHFDLHDWLAWLALLLFALERFLATRKARAATP